MAAEIGRARRLRALVIDARRATDRRHRGITPSPRSSRLRKRSTRVPGTVAAALRAVVAAQAALKRYPSLAAATAKKHFPAAELASSPVS